MSTECAANSFANCSAFQRDLLWVLSHENTRKEFSWKAELNDYYDESISQSHLNQNLDELVDRGLVAKQAHTNEHWLTESARRALSARQARQAGHRDATAAGGHN